MIECTLNIGHTLVNELKNSSHMLLYDNVDKDGFRNSMGNLLVNIQNLVVNNTNINDIWSAFTAGIHDSVSEFVPSRYFKPRTPSQPVWFNLIAKIACNKQRKLYTRFKKMVTQRCLKNIKPSDRKTKNYLDNLKHIYG